MTLTLEREPTIATTPAAPERPIVVVVSADDADAPAEKVTTVDLTPVDRDTKPAKPGTSPSPGESADAPAVAERDDTGCVRFGPWSLLPRPDTKDKTP